MIQAAGEQKIFFAFWPVVLTPSPCRTCHYHHNARFTFSDRHVRFNEPAHPSGHYLSGHSKRRCWDFYEGTVTTGHIHIGRSRRGVAVRIIFVLSRARLSNPNLSTTVNNSLSSAISTAQRERSGEPRGPVYVGKFWRRSVRHKGRVCFRVMSGFTFRRLTVPSIAPQHVVIATSIVSRKIFRRSFHTPFKTWPTFCFNVCSKELWVLFIQRGDIWGRRRRTRREGGWQTSLSLLVWTKIVTATL